MSLVFPKGRGVMVGWSPTAEGTLLSLSLHPAPGVHGEGGYCGDTAG